MDILSRLALENIKVGLAFFRIEVFIMWFGCRFYLTEAYYKIVVSIFDFLDVVFPDPIIRLVVKKKKLYLLPSTKGFWILISIVLPPISSTYRIFGRIPFSVINKSLETWIFSIWVWRDEIFFDSSFIFLPKSRGFFFIQSFRMHFFFIPDGRGIANDPTIPGFQDNC